MFGSSSTMKAPCTLIRTAPGRVMVLVMVEVSGVAASTAAGIFGRSVASWLWGPGRPLDILSPIICPCLSLWDLSLPTTGVVGRPFQQLALAGAEIQELTHLGTSSCKQRCVLPSGLQSKLLRISMVLVIFHKYFTRPSYFYKRRSTTMGNACWPSIVGDRVEGSGAGGRVIQVTTLCSSKQPRGAPTAGQQWENMFSNPKDTGCII